MFIYHSHISNSLDTQRLPGVPFSHYRQHVSADSGIVNVTPHAAASQEAKQGQSEGVAHGVDVQVRDKLRQRLPSQEDGAHALSQQGEVRKQAGLHEQPVPQENKLNRPGKHDVETASRPFQNLLARHTQVPRVHHKVDVHIPVQMWVKFTQQGILMPLSIVCYRLFWLHS